MGSKIFIPATKPEDWKPLLAEPEKHWRKGYSARSLAYCGHDTLAMLKIGEELLKRT